MSKTLTHAEAKRFYDRFGVKQDMQGYYEDRALAEMREYARFEQAGHVFELGCGTGKLAAQLLAGPLPETAHYVGMDISETMIDLSRERLALFGTRVSLSLFDGDYPLPVETGRFDRFLSCYVLDLLADEDITTVIDEAARLVAHGGLLCLVSLGEGTGPLSRFVSGLWRRVHAMRPALVGGCRPLSLSARLGKKDWQIVHRAISVSWGVPSEVLVAKRR